MTVSIPVMVRINEEGGSAQVCAVLSALEATERNFTVALVTSDNTGNAYLHNM